MLMYPNNKYKGNTKITNNAEARPAEGKSRQWGPKVLRELPGWLGDSSMSFFSFPSFCGLDCEIFIVFFQRRGNGKETTCSLQAETQAICVRNMALLHD